MYCPETIVFNKPKLIISHVATHDYITWERVPKSEKLNPLRYELVFNPKGHNQNANPVYINKNGRLAAKLSSLIFKVRSLANK